MTKTKYEIRKNSKYCATCKSLEEAKAMIESKEYPCNDTYNTSYSIVKVTTETVWSEK